MHRPSVHIGAPHRDHRGMRHLLVTWHVVHVKVGWCKQKISGQNVYIYTYCPYKYMEKKHISSYFNCFVCIYIYILYIYMHIHIIYIHIHIYIYRYTIFNKLSWRTWRHGHVTPWLTIFVLRVAEAAKCCLGCAAGCWSHGERWMERNMWNVGWNV